MPDDVILNPGIALVEALGGPTEVARMLTEEQGEPCSQANISNWRSRGIPHRWRLPLYRVAVKKGKADMAGFLIMKTVAA